MAGGSVWRKIIGTIEETFSIGLTGPVLKNSSGIMQVRNNDDSDFERLQVDTPIDDQDAVTKLYADTLEKPLIVKRQADTSSSIPNNTAVRGFVVVTTAGSGAVIGDVLYDDGSSTGLMTILPAAEGRCIAVTDALTGGSVTFEADSINIWDADGGTWIKIGDIGSVTGAIRGIQFTLDNTASQDSAFTIPANAVILRARFRITTPYSGGTSVSMGDTSTADLIMAGTDNNPQKPAGNAFEVPQDTDWPNSSVVRVTVTGSPAAGAGVALVEYTVPNG